MAENEEGFGPNDLREWARDPRGTVFWDTVKEMFPEAISKMRAALKAGETVKAHEYQSHAETLEEILQLPDLIIQQLNPDNEEKQPHDQT